MNTNALIDIAIRIESGIDPSRDLDAEIIRGLDLAEDTQFIWVAGERTGFSIERGDDWPQLRLTASVDAGIALVERMLPDWEFHVGNYKSGDTVVGQAILRRPEQDEGEGLRLAKTPALAIVLAVLKALTSKVREAGNTPGTSTNAVE
jgi:hypothetical protein